MYACHGSRDRVRGGPIRLEQVKTNLAGLKVDVGMADGRNKANGGRRVGVRRRNVNVEKPCAAYRTSVIVELRLRDRRRVRPRPM